MYHDLRGIIGFGGV